MGTGGADLGLIFGALATAFGGNTGGQYPVREVYMNERRLCKYKSSCAQAGLARIPSCLRHENDQKGQAL